MKIELLTSRTCPHCPMAKKVLKEFSSESGMKFTELDTSTKSGQNWSERYAVSSVPTFVVFGDVRPIIKKGVPTQSELQDIVALADGKRSPKKSWLQKLLG
ncbi:MAG: hypothetical protein GOV01_00315 [Candidatus Altiarchaeota archaeon]|nr:hypothetical protein [Candidatus Altiarchaeota archaeon]